MIHCHRLRPLWRRGAGVIAVFALGVAGCSGLAATDGARFAAPERDAITFWGHACAYIDLDGVGIVTDPVFRKTLVFRHRRGPVPPPASYAGARIVLISHAHPDHLDPPTLRTFPDDTVILCPRPVVGHVDDLGHTVVAMEPGETFERDGVRITAVVAHHMGGRWGLRGRADGRALGYVIQGDSTTIFYSGDTNFFSGFSDVGWTYQPDVALVNVNGHLCGTDAVRAMWATRARVTVPMHWGTYPYWMFGGNDRPRDEAMLKEMVEGGLRLLEVGQSMPLPPVARPGHALP
jgi:L-ascorbate metabolism protein UlaG (beta-lactamase superfamily)